jgi:hypothetical protein
MFTALYLDLNSPKSGLRHLTGQPKSQNNRAKARDGIISVCIFLLVRLG